jgi:hypothetical protein
MVVIFWVYFTSGQNALQMKQQSKKCTTNNVSSLFDKGYQERFN